MDIDKEIYFVVDVPKGTELVAIQDKDCIYWENKLGQLLPDHIEVQSENKTITNICGLKQLIAGKKPEHVIVKCAIPGKIEKITYDMYSNDIVRECNRSMRELQLRVTKAIDELDYYWTVSTSLYSRCNTHKGHRFLGSLVIEDTTLKDCTAILSKKEKN